MVLLPLPNNFLFFVWVKLVWYISHLSSFAFAFRQSGLSPSCAESSPTFNPVWFICLSLVVQHSFSRSSVLPCEETFWLFDCRMCVTKLWLEEKVSSKLILFCPCFSLHWAPRHISWLQVATCSSDCWHWFWVWNCGFASASY